MRTFLLALLTAALVRPAAAAPIDWAPIPAAEVEKMRAALPDKPETAPAKARRLLVFYRCDGFAHSAIPYLNKLMELAAERTGAFTVTTSQDYAVFTPENLAPYDAIWFNNTTGLQLTEPQRAALLGFVRGGKGICGNHGATDNFYNWPEGAAMMGGCFAGHPFSKITVKNEAPASPVNASFAGRGFDFEDEIYIFRAPYNRDRLRVILSIDYEQSQAVRRISDAGKKPRADDDYALSWIQRIEQGRSFYCALGHRHEVFWTPAVVRHYLAGLQYAFGDLPADEAPSATVKPNPAEGAVTATDDAAKAAAERAQLAVLADAAATPAAKRLACAVLRHIGGEASVAPLSALLADEALAPAVRHALVNNPSAKADDALLKRLGDLPTPFKAPVISALGMRGTKAAVEPLTALSAGADPACAEAAIGALGRYGTADTVRVLTALKPPAALEPAKDRALLRSADVLLAAGAKDEATGLLRALVERGAARVPALARLNKLDPTTAPAIRKLLADPACGPAAAALIVDSPKPEMAREAAQVLADLPVATKVATLRALGGRGDRALCEPVMAETKAADESVAAAAIAALGDLGNADHVPFLLQTAVAGGERGRAATESLRRLQRGNAKVDEAIGAAAKDGDAPKRALAVDLLGNRGARAQWPLVLAAARDADAKVRNAGLGALDPLARDEDVPALVELFKAATVTADRQRIAGAIQSLYRRSRAKTKVATNLRELLPALPEALTDDNVQRALLALPVEKR